MSENFNPINFKFILWLSVFICQSAPASNSQASRNWELGLQESICITTKNRTIGCGTVVQYKLDNGEINLKVVPTDATTINRAPASVSEQISNISAQPDIGPGNLWNLSLGFASFYQSGTNVPGEYVAGGYTHIPLLDLQNTLSKKIILNLSGAVTGLSSADLLLRYAIFVGINHYSNDSYNGLWFHGGFGLYSQKDKVDVPTKRDMFALRVLGGWRWHAPTGRTGNFGFSMGPELVNDNSQWVTGFLVRLDAGFDFTLSDLFY